VRRLPIERKSNVSQADLKRDHLQGQGMPVIITDAAERWPARSKWTFEFFRSAYGSDWATAPRWESDIARLTKLETYIDFLDTPNVELPGFWVDKNGHPLRIAPEPDAAPPYLMGWHAFQKHPELYDDITPAPYFVLDFVSALSPTLREIFEWTSTYNYWAIYIGSAGSLSPLHRDYWNTHGYLAQIRGRKRAILFSPEDSDFLYSGKVDPEQPDFGLFPLFERATAYECIIEPGETLLMPADWWHYVRGLEKSITVSHNFFNESNFTEHMIRILRNLPTLVEGLERSQEWREELRIRWRSQGFCNPES
jgi:Cupin-like domain